MIGVPKCKVKPGIPESRNAWLPALFDYLELNEL